MDAMKEAETMKKKSQEAVAKAVTEKWMKAEPDNIIHPYLVKKQVAPYGIKQSGSNLLVPLRDAYGKIWSLQYINPKGQKWFAAGGKTKGCFHLMGQVDNSVCIVEGYATGSTLRERTGMPIVVAFYAGNLLSAAFELRAVYPDVNMIFAADNDRYTKGNPGLTKARLAAEAVGGHVIWPTFPEGVEGTDFNDLLMRRGTSDE